MDRKIATLLTRISLLTLALCPAFLPGQSRDSLLARGARYHSLGVTYIQNEQLDSAVYYTRLAVRDREAALGDTPDINLGKSNFNAGRALNGRSDYAAARPYLERALAIYRGLDLPPDQTHRPPTTAIELAKALSGIGDFAAAKNQLRVAMTETGAATEVTMLRKYDLEALCYAELGGILFEQDSLEAARPYLERSAELYRGLIRLEDDNFGWYLGNSLVPRFNMAVTQQKLKDYPAAEKELLGLLEIYADNDITSELANGCNVLALLYIETGQLSKARTFLTKGKLAAIQANIPQYKAQNDDHWGSLYLAEGKPAEAAAFFQQAQATLLPEYSPVNITDVPQLAELRYADNQQDLFLYINDQARALDAMDGKGAEIAEALSQLYRTGDALLDDLRQQHSGQASKFFWREKTAAFYESAIKHCHQANLPEDAFFFFEKSKAVLLYDAIRGSDALRELPDTLRQREKQLARAVTRAQSEMGTSEAQDRTEALQAVISAQGNLSEFRRQLRSRFPHYRALTENVVVPAPTTFHERTLVSTGQALLHYFMGPTQTFALYLDQSGLKTFNLGKTDGLQQIATELLAYFSKPTDIQNDPAGYAAAAFTVYQAFLAPLSLPANQSLLIIPDGPLTYVPFPALLTEEVSTANQLSRLPYLVRRHPVSYGHSASILSRKQPANTSGDRIVAFAPFVNGSATLAYPPLPFSQDELQQITESFQVELLTSEAATLARFREKAAYANILHLSTHAFASTDAGAPLIAFHDQPLFLREVYHQDLNADLVVLSACQTNIGKLAKGEGVLGLGRGFIQAGAASVIASLWNVNARSGGQVLSTFYQTLGQGETKGKALHLAQLRYLDDATMRDVEKSPYLWAGLTYYGTETGLELQPAKNSKAFLWGALVGVLGLTLVLVWYNRARE
ncbi:CHAT domain-containing protein [Neolewinella persica]|uniref:CHAT domain-containing protein n=1 Tax=Neolewinella persica TaxID=70998 RepID=UPI0003733069|nr:CHAT domain-containing tetratricopeptide repeat protein [Neolewinella persica]